MNTAAENETLSAYPPLAQVRQTLRVKWYRSPISHDRLRELSTRTDSQGWIQAGGHVAIFLITGTLSVTFWVLEAWWLFAFTLWCHGFCATFFKGTAAHELGHGTVFNTKWLNRVFLYVVCLISWWDPFDYSTSHTYHHRYTTYPRADRENLLPIQPSLHPWLLLQLFTLNLFVKPGRNFSKGGFFWTIYLTLRTALNLPHAHVDIPSQEWIKVLREDQPLAFRQSILFSRTLLLLHGFIALLAIATGWWVLPLVLTIPSYIANCGSYFVGITQHCGLQENVSDFRKNTRSIRINPVLEFFYWHMNWHIEHHMYAGVPCYNLKKLATEISEDMPVPRTLLGAWREMRKTWRIQQGDPHYQFDTPLPDTAQLTVMHTEAPIAQSIGDLAPKGWRVSN